MQEAAHAGYPNNIPDMIANEEESETLRSLVNGFVSILSESDTPDIIIRLLIIIYGSSEGRMPLYQRIMPFLAPVSIICGLRIISINIDNINNGLNIFFILKYIIIIARLFN